MIEGIKLDVLDHGYVQAIDVWGSDERVIEAARMSTQKGFQGWGPIHHGVCAIARGDAETLRQPVPQCGCEGGPKPGDEKLLAYLWNNKHHTPFEMAGLTIEASVPIFVVREWQRHRVPFGYNEMSSRYAPLPDVNYVPTVERLMMGGGHLTKQAGSDAGAAELDVDAAERYRMRLVAQYAEAESFYRYALARGVPKELARIHLPVGRYSRMRVTSNLRGWLGFLKLRNHRAAQWEIQQYAKQVDTLLGMAFPRTMQLHREEMQRAEAAR